MNYVIYILLFILIFIIVLIVQIVQIKLNKYGGKSKKGIKKQDLHNDKQGLHNDKQGLHNDKRGLHNDKRGLHNDKRGLHNDKRGLHNDKRGLRSDNIEINKQRGLRSDNIEINCIPLITSHLLHDILNIIKKRHSVVPNYNIMSNDDISFYERQAHLLENKYKIKYEILKNQLFSIRNAELLVYISQCKKRVQGMAKIIKEDFENGFDVTLIADKHKLPYIMTLKQLCFTFGYSKEDIKKFLKKEKKIPNKLQALNSEIDFILKSDPTSYINSLDSKKRANKFEKEVAMFLDSKHIKYTTENEIKKDGSSGIITPDFLLNHTIKINNFTTNWIEVKNYAYYGNIILEPGIQAQATKYYNKYGNGIFIFKYGLINDYNQKNPKNGVYFMGWKDDI